MKKELIEELNILKDKADELLDRANTVASELVLIESESLKNLEEQKLYKLLNNDHIDLNEHIEKVIANFNFENAFNLYKLFCEKIDFIESDISMSEALSESTLEDELFVFNYIKVAFCIKDLDLMLKNFDTILENLSNLK